MTIDETPAELPQQPAEDEERVQLTEPEWLGPGVVDPEFDDVETDVDR